ncbi:hypothetical protein BDQ17DRAFT_1437126 [Cyathus striatus]|nr:hypothetical protein BDQ17DRAFT_1437126 [Cyathus striatus]
MSSGLASNSANATENAPDNRERSLLDNARGEGSLIAAQEPLAETSHTASSAEAKSRAARRSLATKVSEILPYLKDAYLSPFDVVGALLDENNVEF